MIGGNGGSIVSHDVVKLKVGERMMDRWATSKLNDWAAGRKGNEKTKEAMGDELAEAAAEFAGPSPTPLEATLAQTAAILWFALGLHEAQYGNCATSEGGLR